MIDNPEKVDHLLASLTSALPVLARTTSELRAMLRQKNGNPTIGATCSIVAVHYAGDEGGIMCSLDFGPYASSAVVTSITHLRFDPRLPLAREIAVYQRHRVKRIRRQH